MTNRRLASIVEEWIQQGRPPQEAFNWKKSRKNWIRDIPTERSFIENLSVELSRGYLRAIHDLKKSKTSEIFVASMIWGYGDLGYGSYRVKKMFSTPGFQEKIDKSYELASTGRVLEAYEFLSKNRIRQLGPAFGTKWLSFASPSEEPAPIYDSFIALWVDKFAKQDFAGVTTSSVVWNKRTYGAYFEWIQKNSVAFRVKPDDLELVIFKDATMEFSARSKWIEL